MSRTAAPDEITLFSGDHLRATCRWPDRPDLIVRFDHWTAGRRGFDDSATGNGFAKAGRASLRIETARNDWFLNPDLPALRRVLARFTARFRHATGFGFSMGGYGALLLADCLHLDQAVLVSPQYSIRPDRAPFDRRWRAEAKLIDPDQDAFDPAAAARLSGVVIYDPSLRADRLHRRLICAAFPRLAPLPLAFGGHPATQVIHRDGRYGQFLAQVFSEAANPAVIRGLHRHVRRGSATYGTGLAAYLARRAARIPAA